MHKHRIFFQILILIRCIQSICVEDLDCTSRGEAETWHCPYEENGCYETESLCENVCSLSSYVFFGLGECAVSDDGDGPGELNDVYNVLNNLEDYVSTLQGCADLCSEYSECIAFRYRVTENERCEIYDSTKGPIVAIDEDSEYVCFVRSDRVPGYELYGNGDCGVNGDGSNPGELETIYQSLVAAQDIQNSVSSCSQLCNNYQECVAFQFDRLYNQECKLYEASLGTIDSLDQINGFGCYLKISGESTVNCGAHTASSCAECPQGNGSAWCNGECMWYYNACVSISATDLFFSVVGDCDVENDCVSSKNYPISHGNEESCTVSVLRDSSLTVSEPFQVEAYSDRLTFDGSYVIQREQVPTVLYAGDTFTWTTDTSITYGGWQICFSDWPPGCYMKKEDASNCVDAGMSDIDSYEQCRGAFQTWISRDATVSRAPLMQKAQTLPQGCIFSQDSDGAYEVWYNPLSTGFHCAQEGIYHCLCQSECDSLTPSANSTRIPTQAQTLRPTQSPSQVQPSTTLSPTAWPTARPTALLVCTIDLLEGPGGCNANDRHCYKCNTGVRFNSSPYFPGSDADYCAREYAKNGTVSGFISFREGRCFYDEECDWSSLVTTESFELYAFNCTEAEPPTIHPTSNLLVPTRDPTEDPTECPTIEPTTFPTLLPSLHVEGYTLMYTGTRQTCGNVYKLQDTGTSQSVTDLDGCKALCEAEEECNYFFLNSYPTCLTYSDCDRTRNANNEGSTFRKDSHEYCDKSLWEDNDENCGDCRSIISNMDEYGTCRNYCQVHGLNCLTASVGDNVECSGDLESPESCDMNTEEDALCHCTEDCEDGEFWDGDSCLSCYEYHHDFTCLNVGTASLGIQAVANCEACYPEPCFFSNAKCSWSLYGGKWLHSYGTAQSCGGLVQITPDCIDKEYFFLSSENQHCGCYQIATNDCEIRDEVEANPKHVYRYSGLCNDEETTESPENVVMKEVKFMMTLGMTLELFQANIDTIKTTLENIFNLDRTFNFNPVDVVATMELSRRRRRLDEVETEVTIQTDDEKPIVDTINSENFDEDLGHALTRDIGVTVTVSDVSSPTIIINPCIHVICPQVLCNDGSIPEIPSGECCPSQDLCNNGSLIPTFEPTLSPTDFPTVDCITYDTEVLCRQHGCAFQRNVCRANCTRVFDLIAVGTRIGGSNIVSTLAECEQICLQTPNCQKYSHASSTCAIFSEVESTTVSFGAIMGICVDIVSPTSLPSSAVGSIKADEESDTSISPVIIALSMVVLILILCVAIVYMWQRKATSKKSEEAEIIELSGLHHADLDDIALDSDASMPYSNSRKMSEGTRGLEGHVKRLPEANINVPGSPMEAPGSPSNSDYQSLPGLHKKESLASEIYSVESGGGDLQGEGELPDTPGLSLVGEMSHRNPKQPGGRENSLSLSEDPAGLYADKTDEGDDGTASKLELEGDGGAKTTISKISE